MARVSVIIPVYNVEDYLAECLDSVTGQTYDDLEILCIDDCSTDSSCAILQRYAKKDSRIRILENEQNQGQAYTRNVGISNAAGEYILFVDSDDVIRPDLVEKCIGAVGDSDMVCFDYKQVMDSGTDVKQDRYQMRDGMYAGSSFFAEAVYKESVIIAPWSKLYRRRFLMENHIGFYSGIIYEDILFSFQCYLKAGKVCSLNRKLYVYRVRERSTMRAEITERNIGSYVICICELMRSYLHGEFDSETGAAVEEYIRKIGREYISVYRRWGRQEAVPGLLEDKPEYLKLYRTFSELFVRPGKIPELSPEQLEQIRRYPYVILYGAGDIARSTVEILDCYDIPISGIAVTSLEGNRKSMLGSPVRELSAYHAIKDQCLVILGTTPKYYQGIREELQKQGFMHLMGIVNVQDEGEDER